MAGSRRAHSKAAKANQGFRTNSPSLSQRGASADAELTPTIESAGPIDLKDLDLGARAIPVNESIQSPAELTHVTNTLRRMNADQEGPSSPEPISSLHSYTPGYLDFIQPAGKNGYADHRIDAAAQESPEPPTFDITHDSPFFNGFTKSGKPLDPASPKYAASDSTIFAAQDLHSPYEYGAPPPFYPYYQALPYGMSPYAFLPAPYTNGYVALSSPVMSPTSMSLSIPEAELVDAPPAKPAQKPGPPPILPAPAPGTISMMVAANHLHAQRYPAPPHVVQPRSAAGAPTRVHHGSGAGSPCYAPYSPYMGHGRGAQLQPHASPLKKRHRLGPEETTVLCAVFARCPRPSLALRTELAVRLGMPARSIQIWFQNRRAKTKRDTSEHVPSLTFSPLPSCSDVDVDSCMTSIAASDAAIEMEQEAEDALQGHVVGLDVPAVRPVPHTLSEEEYTSGTKTGSATVQEPSSEDDGLAFLPNGPGLSSSEASSEGGLYELHQPHRHHQSHRRPHSHHALQPVDLLEPLHAYGDALGHDAFHHPLHTDWQSFTGHSDAAPTDALSVQGDKESLLFDLYIRSDSPHDGGAAGGTESGSLSCMAIPTLRIESMSCSTAPTSKSLPTAMKTSAQHARSTAIGGHLSSDVSESVLSL